MADPTCGAELDWPDAEHLHVCASPPNHDHMRCHVCGCGYAWPRIVGGPAPDTDSEQLLAQIEERRNDPEFMGRIRVSIERNRPLLDRLAFDDGGPATPGPTRDRVIGVISEAMYAWASLSDSEMAEHLDDAGEPGFLADAVMVLFGRSAPEPPATPANDTAVMATSCLTPGAQFHVNISDDAVSCVVDLPAPLVFTDDDPVVLDTLLHDAVELALAKHWPREQSDG